MICHQTGYFCQITLKLKRRKTIHFYYNTLEKIYGQKDPESDSIILQEKLQMKSSMIIYSI